METSIFTDKSAKPDNSRLTKAIGDKVKYWEAIKKHIEDKYGAVNELEKLVTAI